MVLGFRAWGSEFRFQRMGLKVWGLGFRRAEYTDHRMTACLFAQCPCVFPREDSTIHTFIRLPVQLGPELADLYKPLDPKP